MKEHLSQTSEELPVDRAKIHQVLLAHGITSLEMKVLNAMSDKGVFSLALWYVKEENTMTVEEFMTDYLGQEEAERLRDQWETYI